MIKITHTVVDVADCNVTFGALDAAAPPLPFSSGDAYNNFYGMVASKQPYYDDLCGRESAILWRLRPAYTNNKFWMKYYFASEDIRFYAGQAWDTLLPVSATLTDRVEIETAGEDPPYRISPVPTVLLYPFGWANWMSFRIVGEYSLNDLAEIVRYVITAQAYRIEETDEKLHTLREVFDFVSQRVRKDAYDPASLMRNPQKLLTVTTVLGKSGGAPALHALGDDEERALRQILRPGGGGQPAAELSTMATRLPYGGSIDFDYVLREGTSWFIWANHKLWAEARNHQQLLCYHHNTFRSLLQVWMLENLLTHAAATRKWSAAVTEIAGNAVSRIESSSVLGSYQSVTLNAHLKRPEILKVVDEAKKRLVPPKPAP